MENEICYLKLCLVLQKIIFNTEKCIYDKILFFTIREEAEDIFDNILCESLKEYHEKMVVDTRVSDFIFFYVDKMYFYCNKRPLNSGRTYLESPN